MFRIPRWLFILLLPVLFFGGCVYSLPPAWSLIERGWIRPVTESDHVIFPILVKKQTGGYAVARLRSVPPGSVVMTNGFDEAAINVDLNALIGATGRAKFFRMIEHSPELTRVTLEVPTLHESKLKGWYDIRGGEIIPQKVMSYGPGFALVVFPATILCGLIVATLFAYFVRPKTKRNEAERQT